MEKPEFTSVLIYNLHQLQEVYIPHVKSCLDSEIFEGSEEHIISDLYCTENYSQTI